MIENKNSYKTIFKSTFLFGFVQVFNIIAKVGINKAVAVFLGTEGMGLIGLYQSTISLLNTACGLGISQSAIKDIAQGAGVSPEQFSKTISLTQKIILLLALFGAITTLLISSWLSQWTFGSDQYTYAFMWLSIVVFMNILTEGQLAILKGARMLRLLAKATLLGSVVGLLTSVPLYFWLGESGIVPSLIIAALTAAFFSWLFIRRVHYRKQVFTVKTALKDGRSMIQMGIALMYVTFIGVVSDYVIRTYISNTSSIEMVGLFQAGAMIVTSYFGVVVTALATDYYPRISAINQDNRAIEIEFNRQGEVGLLLVGPLIILFLFALPLFIKILYTNTFIPVLDYLEFAVFGVLFTVSSNALGMILLAKQASKTFFLTATLGRIIVVAVSLIFFNLWGLRGLGLAALITGIFHLLLMSAVLWKKYRICFNKGLVYLTLSMMFFAVIAFFIKDIDDIVLRLSLGSFMFVATIYYSLHRAKITMGIDFIAFVKAKIKKR